MENNLFYLFPNAQTKYLNLARDLSIVNSKNEEITTRDGHVFGYAVEFEATASAGGSITVHSAPNSWRMRNSFRKFHAYRNIMFENAGVTGNELGKYGKTIRPYLDSMHLADGSNTLDPVTEYSDPSAGVRVLTGGDWTYSELAVTPAYEEGVPVTPELDWADSFDLTICDPNVVQGSSEFESGYYKRVGMIHSYNLDRQDVFTPTTAGEVISGPSNPLSQLISSGNQAVGEVIDIAEEQELEAPPYDITDDGDSVYALVNSFGASSASIPTFRFTAFLPAGLARISVGSGTNLRVRVLGKMLCKDMA